MIIIKNRKSGKLSISDAPMTVTFIIRCISHTFGEFVFNIFEFIWCIICDGANYNLREVIRYALCF